MAFDDGTSQVIDFESVARGQLFGPLRDPEPFKQVRIDAGPTRLTSTPAMSERKPGDVANHFLFENERVRVWQMDLGPGASSGFHEHTLPYSALHPRVCTLLAAGRSRGRIGVRQAPM